MEVIKTWDVLPAEDRMRLLRAAYPTRIDALLNFEAGLAWNKLLPSTQADVEMLNWPEIFEDPRIGDAR